MYGRWLILRSDGREFHGRNSVRPRLTEGKRLEVGALRR
jgi:hypothetical protein